MNAGGAFRVGYRRRRRTERTSNMQHENENTLSDNNSGRPGFYMAYLEKLRQRREQAGLRPAPDITPESYWQRRRELEDIEERAAEESGVKGKL